MRIIPDAALREYNTCHDARGRFCAGASHGTITPPRRGGQSARATKLTGRPEDYFTIDGQTVMLPLARIRTQKYQPKSIAVAIERMNAASQGNMAKRKPISVRRERDGSYTVLDGNATTGAARRSGWRTIPAHIEQ